MTAETTPRNVPLPITGTCHCGAVSYEMRVPPRYAVACNCSVCRSLGAVWGHGDAGDITVTAAPGATLGYSHGGKDLVFHTCRTCGSTTHWEGVSREVKNRMAVNLKLAPSGTIEAIGVKHFDGAETRTFLD